MVKKVRWQAGGDPRIARGFAHRLVPPIIVEAHRFIADEDYVVVEARGRNTTKDGVPYNNVYCYVFRLADGKLQEMTEYMDTELVTAALGAPVTNSPANN